MDNQVNSAPLRKRKYAEYIQDFTALGNPFLLLLVSFASLQGITWQSHRVLWAILIGGFLANEVICSTIKYIWHKPRPNQQGFADGMEKIDAGSFPSIHAARISFVYASLSYIQYTQNQSLIFAMIALIVVVVVGYSRVFLRKHFPVDVAAGYGFGAAMWWLCWCICF